MTYEEEERWPTQSIPTRQPSPPPMPPQDRQAHRHRRAGRQHVPQAPGGPAQVPEPALADRSDAVPGADGPVHAGREARRHRRAADQVAALHSGRRKPPGCWASDRGRSTDGTDVRASSPACGSTRQRTDPPDREHRCAPSTASRKSFAPATVPPARSTPTVRRPNGLTGHRARFPSFPAQARGKQCFARCSPASAACGPPDDDGRHRQQHRQRQHDRLQVQPASCSRTCSARCIRAPAAPQQRRGGTNPAQVGLGVQLGRHHHQLHPGRAAADRPVDRHDDPGRRLLRRRPGRRSGCTPGPARFVRRRRPAGHPGRRRRAGLAGRPHGTIDTNGADRRHQDAARASRSPPVATTNVDASAATSPADAADRPRRSSPPITRLRRSRATSDDRSEVHVVNTAPPASGRSPRPGRSAATGTTALAPVTLRPTARTGQLGHARPHRRRATGAVGRTRRPSTSTGATPA